MSCGCESEKSNIYVVKTTEKCFWSIGIIFFSENLLFLFKLVNKRFLQLKKAVKEIKRSIKQKDK